MRCFVLGKSPINSPHPFKTLNLRQGSISGTFAAKVASAPNRSWFRKTYRLDSPRTEPSSVFALPIHDHPSPPDRPCLKIATGNSKLFHPGVQCRLRQPQFADCQAHGAPAIAENAQALCRPLLVPQELSARFTALSRPAFSPVHSTTTHRRLTAV